MNPVSSKLLYLASAITLFASLLHYACIAWGADGFRFMGAGEAIAQMAERGHWYPAFVAALVGTALWIAALAACAAARGKPKLPLHRWILAVTAVVFMLRGLAFPLLKPVFPENSDAFWLTTSALCLFTGTLYALGAWNFWRSQTQPKLQLTGRKI